MSDSRALVRLLPAVFAIQAGFHGFTGALPVALAAIAGVLTLADPSLRRPHRRQLPPAPM